MIFLNQFGSEYSGSQLAIFVKINERSECLYIDLGDFLSVFFSKKILKIVYALNF